jgi:hypothetical protein
VSDKACYRHLPESNDWRFPIALRIRAGASECDTAFAKVCTKAGTISIQEIVDEEERVLE